MPVKDKIIVIFLIVVITVAGIFYFIPAEEPVRITVDPGMSAPAVAGMLEEEGVIGKARFFLMLARILGKDRKIKAGTYYISSGAYISILRSLTRGSEHLIKVSIPEGFRTEQIAARLYHHNIIDDPEEFVQKVEKKDLRGFLFPETYRFPEGMPQETVIDTMLAQFNRVFTEEWEERVREMDFSIKEIVTLASLIERETRVPEERPIISDVFHKRLGKRMYLESCASVQFILGQVKPNLTYADLEIESPYNTYRNFGLPPTPIARPGEASLKAALYPEDTDYLFFFERGDGSHEFSESYEEHLRRQREVSSQFLNP